MDYWGGGGQRVCWPPLSNYGGGGLPPHPPLPTPMRHDSNSSIHTLDFFEAAVICKCFENIYFCRYNVYQKKHVNLE